MTSHVLSVGQCNADDARLGRMLAVEADAHLDRAHTAEEGLRKIGEKPYDLVLINRILDGDGQSGVEFIRAARSGGHSVPMMLVSDYADAQQAAVAEGAVRGFGKGSLEQAEVGQLLRQTLHSATRAGRGSVGANGGSMVP